jgi:hypothetical protein
MKAVRTEAKAQHRDCCRDRDGRHRIASPNLHAAAFQGGERVVRRAEREPCEDAAELSRRRREFFRHRVGDCGELGNKLTSCMHSTATSIMLK